MTFGSPPHGWGHGVSTDENYATWRNNDHMDITEKNRAKMDIFLILTCLLGSGLITGRCSVYGSMCMDVHTGVLTSGRLITAICQPTFTL